MAAQLTSHEIMQELQRLCEGLLWPSEADYPIEVIHWPAQVAPLAVEDILRLGDHDPDAIVETVALQDVFCNLVREPDWFGEAERAKARQFQALQETLGQLSPPQVYQVGQVEIALYIVGLLEDRGIAGIKTQIVET